MVTRFAARKWLAAAVIPAVFGVYYAFALPGHTTAHAAPQASPATHDTASRTQRLPDFTSIVEENGAAVVNVAVSRSAPSAQNQPGAPNAAPDDPLQEFFRRFGPPGQQGPGPQDEPQVQRGLGSG